MPRGWRPAGGTAASPIQAVRVAPSLRRGRTDFVTGTAELFAGEGGRSQHPDCLKKGFRADFFPAGFFFRPRALPTGPATYSSAESMWRVGPSLRLTGAMAANRDRAHGARREAFRLDPEAAVEACPEILPRDRRGQLHHLPRVEMLAQAVEQLLRDVGRRPRQRRRNAGPAFPARRRPGSPQRRPGLPAAVR